MKRFLLATITLLVLTGCGSTSELSAEQQRNNFDSCTINFIKSVPSSSYSAGKNSFDKQAKEACGPLLTMNKSETEKFTEPKYDAKKSTEVSAVSMKEVCKLVTSAAYAHNEFDTNAIGETIDYEVWYSRIQSYFKKATAILRQLPGNYTNLIAASEQASLNARGVNAGLTNGEAMLYAECGISEEKVWANFEKWMG